MAESGSWPLIREHGLLSTTEILNLFGLAGEERRVIESEHRPDSVEIAHPDVGTAVVRDQKPMSDASLEAALEDGLSPSDWYELLNRKTFFWTSTNRLHRLLNARPYRDKSHDVLTVSTEELVLTYDGSILLSSMNSGCSIPFRHKRGTGTFLSIEGYDLSAWDSRRPKWDSVVELAVEGGVPNIVEFVLSVDEMRGAEVIRNIWTRP
jgi:hypothetical protein